MMRTIKIILIVVAIYVIASSCKILLKEGNSRIDRIIAVECGTHLRFIHKHFYNHMLIAKLESSVISRWSDIVSDASGATALVCVLDANTDVKCSYAINENTVKYKFEELPDNLVLFFESDLGWIIAMLWVNTSSNISLACDSMFLALRTLPISLQDCLSSGIKPAIPIISFGL